MGCDIHITVEVQGSRGWRCVSQFTDPDKDGNCLVNGGVYDGRNYLLFGLLAGVRDKRVQAIDSPRGFPIGVSATSLGFHASVSDHSHTWLTVKEILRSDVWYQTVDCDAYASAWMADLINDEGLIPRWGYSPEPAGCCQVPAHWDEPVYYSCKEFLADVAMLMRYSAIGDGSDVRLVIGFDS